MTLSGAQGTPFPGMDDGIRAAIEATNRAGGIAGRKIVIGNVLDDGGNPNTNTDQVHKAVEQDKVFAVFMTSNAAQQQSTDYLKANKVPFFGWAYLPNYCENTWGFGWNGCVDATHSTDSSIPDSLAAAVGKKASQLKFAVQGADDAASAGSTTLVADKFKARGGNVVYTDTSIPGATQTTDYSPYVQRILAKSPDVVYVSANFQNVVGLTGALIAAGYKGVVANGVGYVPGLLEKSPDVAKGLEGAYIYNSVPAAEEGTPAIQQMKANVKAINKPVNLTLGLSVGYWSADMFTQMLQAVGKDLTADNFSTKINGGFTTTPPKGGPCPVTFAADHLKSAGGAGVEQVKGGKYVVSVPFKCYPQMTQ
ncbi:MAG: hypothetical protein JWL73_2856 [Actinomycetia bacterium]|nr:hypothetical protein [Actinomycetes bacterium]